MRYILFVLMLVVLGYSKDFEVIRIVSVYDGDTFKVDIKDVNSSYIGNDIFYKNIPIRLRGIDTPEKRTKNKWEKLLSKDSLDITKKFVSNNIVLSNCSRGKYFRLVCDVSYKNILLKDVLSELGLGLEYNGGTKDSFYKNLNENQYKILHKIKVDNDKKSSKEVQE